MTEKANAESWGAIPIEDKRLKGWSLSTYGPPGVTVTVTDTWPTVIERGGFEEGHLAVAITTTWPDGSVDQGLLFARKAGRGRLDSLPGLGRYIKTLALPDDPATWRDRLVADEDAWMSGAIFKERWAVKGQPSLDAAIIFDFLSLNDSFGDLERCEGSIQITHDHLAELLDRAYRLGRDVRNAEFPSDHARSKSAKSSLERTLDAEAWWLVGSQWAQALVDAYPKGWAKGRRLGRNGLASQIYDDWAARPFAPFGPSTVEVVDLAKRILVRWEERGWLTLPKRSGSST